MEKFLNEIEKLSQSLEKSDTPSLKPALCSPAVEKLFDITNAGIEVFNAKGIDSIKIYSLPPDILPLFFTFENETAGYVIKTDKKYIFVVGCDPNKIFIYGTGSDGPISIRGGASKTMQLFNLEFSEAENDILFFDNTNKRIEPEEVVLHVIKWGFS